MKRFSIFQKHKATGNMTWYGRISEDGLFHVVSLGSKKKADAVAWLDLMNAKKFLPEAFANEKPDANLVELSHKFIDSCDTANNASFATIKAYQLRISYFLEWAKEHGKIQVSQVTDKDAIDFSTVIATRYAPKTAGEIIKLTKAMFSFSHKIFKTESNPFEFVRRPRIKKSIKSFWTPEEINAILAAAPSAEYRKFWALMVFAGLRYFEARDLRWKDVKDGKITLIGKGDKLATIPLSERLKTEIGAGEDDEDTIIEPGTFANNTSSIRALRKAVVTAGLDPNGANNHKFRHSFISNLIRSGVNVKAVQQLARHESIDITLNTYSHLLQDDLKDAVNAI